MQTDKEMLYGKTTTGCLLGYPFAQGFVLGRFGVSDQPLHAFSAKVLNELQEFDSCSAFFSTTFLEEEVLQSEYCAQTKSLHITISDIGLKIKI